MIESPLEWSTHDSDGHFPTLWLTRPATLMTNHQFNRQVFGTSQTFPIPTGVSDETWEVMSHWTSKSICRDEKLLPKRRPPRPRPMEIHHSIKRINYGWLPDWLQTSSPPCPVARCRYDGCDGCVSINHPFFLSFSLSSLPDCLWLTLDGTPVAGPAPPHGYSIDSIEKERRQALWVDASLIWKIKGFPLSLSF